MVVVSPSSVTAVTLRMWRAGPPLFAALDFNTPLPLQTRIDSIGAACREVLHPSSAHINAEQLPVDALTHALLHSDEHLGEALVELLEALLDKSSDPSELSRRQGQSGPESGSSSVSVSVSGSGSGSGSDPDPDSAGGCCSARSSRSSFTWEARPAWPGQPLPAGPVGRGRRHPL